MEAVGGLLVRRGVDRRAEKMDSEKALHFSAGGGHRTVVEILVKLGEDMTATCSDGDTALH